MCGAQWACGWDGPCVQGGDEAPPGLPIIKGEVTGAGGGQERVKSLEDPWSSVWRAATAHHLAGCAEGRGQDLWVSGRHHVTVLGQGRLWKMQRVLSGSFSPRDTGHKAPVGLPGSGVQAPTSPWARCLCVQGPEQAAWEPVAPGLQACSLVPFPNCIYSVGPQAGL